jgi:hypothetical protein
MRINWFDMGARGSMGYSLGRFLPPGPREIRPNNAASSYLLPEVPTDTIAAP